MSLMGCIPSSTVHAQFLMDIADTTKDLGKGILSVYKRFDHIRLGGYIQPQFQLAGSKGAAGYSGGNFSEFSNNRFMLRRGRIRFDFARFDVQNRPRLQFVFQFDGTERGVAIRDFWGRYWDNRWQVFHVTTGMFARPFGYEVNLSSGDREAPERGRMSQVLMRTERDLGFMVSVEPVHAGGFWKYVKFDAGVFNGQGLTGTTDTDSYKDFITQAVIKPVSFHRGLSIGGGVSVLAGGIRQWHSQVARMGTHADGRAFMFMDSVSSGVGDRLPRLYYGMNLQVKWKYVAGTTEFRAEYWRGNQTATRYASETPAGPIVALTGDVLEPCVRPFDGMFLMLLHRIGNSRTQLGVKYDTYDPNRRVAGDDIGHVSTNLNAADISYATLGAGFIREVTDNMKLVCWYDRVRNEKTGLTGFRQDLSDDVLTVRVQYRF